MMVVLILGEKVGILLLIRTLLKVHLMTLKR